MARYSETLTEHVMTPRNCGVIEDADLTGRAGSAARCVHDPLPEGRRRANRGGKISHGRMRADDCERLDPDGDDQREIDRGMQEADGRDLIDALDGVPAG